LERKVKVATVSYLNVLPLTYGFEGHEVMNMMELSQDYPSNVAQQLLDGTVDVAMVPVAVIPQLKEAHIISDYCIGAEGTVASVCLFSEVPLQQIKRIYLDYQSKTSVALLKILLEKHWKLSVELIDAPGGFENLIEGTDAGLIIGDRALAKRKSAAFIYDLAEAWIRYTSLPFVFATWVSNKPVPEAFKLAFNEANKIGLNHIPEVVASAEFPDYDLKKYYTENISYKLTPHKRQGMQRFLRELI
jgi:chorismate dehydratase